MKLFWIFASKYISSREVHSIKNDCTQFFQHNFICNGFVLTVACYSIIVDTAQLFETHTI